MSKGNINAFNLNRRDFVKSSSLVAKGDLITGIGNEGYGCEQSVTLKVPDCYELWRSSQNYGHHFSLVYGDFTREMRDLGDMMDFEVEMI
jgi:hypothetical protein